MHSNANGITTLMTTYPTPERTSSENVAAALIISVIVTVSMAGNGLVLLSYVMCSKIRSSPGNWFIFNLAMSDLSSTVYIMMPCVVSLANPEWHLQNGSCIAHAIITWIIMTASNWILAAISLDRAIAMTRPFQYKSYVSTTRVRWAMIITWLFSIIVSSSLVKGDEIAFNNWELMCTPRWTEKSKTQAYFAAILCFWVPASTVVLSNIAVINAARRMRSLVSGTGRDSSIQEGSRTLRSLYVLVATYLLCTCPYFLAKFSFVSHRKGFFPPSMLVLFITSMFLASAANPFIYAILRKDMREAYLTTLRILMERVRQCFSRNRTVVGVIDHQQELTSGHPQEDPQPVRIALDELSLRISVIPGAVDIQ